MSMPGCIDMQNVFLFLSVGLVAINLILMEFMQNTIEKEDHPSAGHDDSERRTHHHRSGMEP